MSSLLLDEESMNSPQSCSSPSSFGAGWQKEYSRSWTWSRQGRTITILHMQVTKVDRNILVVRIFESSMGARALTLMILGLCAALIIGQSLWVKQKCPRWLTPICISNPILVKVRLGSLNTAAKLTRMSTLSNFYLMRALKSSIDLRSARSSGQKMMLAFGFLRRISLRASSDFLTSLAPKIMVQSWKESSSTVSLPIPVFPPVTTITLPLSSRLTLHVPPLKYCLAAKSKPNVMVDARRRCGR